MSRRAAVLVTAIAALVLAMAAVLVLRQEPEEPPFPASDLGITASLEQVSADVAHTAVPEFLPAAHPEDDVVLGRVSWDEPPRPLNGGWLSILVIDQRTFTKPGQIFTESEGGRTTTGSDGVLNKVEERYPWLRGAGDFKVDNGWLSVGSRIAVHDDDVASIDFVVPFPPTAEPIPGTDTPRIPTAPVDVSELLLAMVYIGEDREIHWAERLVG